MRSITRAAGACALVLAGLAAPASAQSIFRPFRSADPGYRRATPGYYAPVQGGRLVRPGPALPYNRSPYTDDWSTGRHLPYPKPWMLPTRDPAARGR